MVDLGSTICRWYSYVVDIEIDIGIEENLFSKGNLSLSYPSLYGSFYRHIADLHFQIIQKL